MVFDSYCASGLHFFSNNSGLMSRQKQREAEPKLCLSQHVPSSIPFDIAYYSEPPRAVPIQNHKPAGAEYDNLSVFTAYGADAVIIR